MVVRRYNISDADMCQQNRVIRQLFIDNKTDFTNEDVDFADPFADNWLTAIEAAEAVQTAETRGDALQQESEDVEEQMQTGRNEVTKLKYFVDKAFKTKPAILNELGFPGYGNVSHNQGDFITFLSSLYTLANGKHKAPPYP